ncbi:hypothetical protein SDC9_114194 [bioreactor metagenome]|uniref:Uncharacterized protein n=1 Tax=bioreactor metagenome TaxID=1076179 RepID=A0A645BPY4_9ZZZZ
MLTVYFSENLVLFPIHIKISHTLTAQCILEGLTDIPCAYAQKSCLVTININSGFRHGKLQIHISHLKFRTLVYLLQKNRNKFFQLINTCCLKYILNRHRSSSSSEGGLLLNKGSGFALFSYRCREPVGIFHL